MTLTALPGASSCKGIDVHTTHLHQALPGNDPSHTQKDRVAKHGRGLTFIWRHVDQPTRSSKASTERAAQKSNRHTRQPSNKSDETKKRRSMTGAKLYSIEI